MFFFRYEDMLTKPKETLLEIFSYLLEKRDLSGTYVKQRIKDILSKGSKASQSYKTKKIGMNKHAFRYTES